MKHLRALALTALLALAGGIGVARAQGGGPPVGWLRLSSDAPLRGRWSLYSEVETRQSNAYLSAQQLGRVGLRLHLGNSLSFTTGYVLAYNECQSGTGLRQPLPEHRLYQEVAVADFSGPLRASHRLRAEERWLRPALEAPFQFAPRLRYQLRLVAPLHRAGKLPVGAFYLTAADEAFIGLGARVSRSFFEENRASAGLGYHLSRPTTVELVYLHQNQTAAPEGLALVRNAVQVNLAYAPPLRASLVRR
jgi:hypothetical protein